MAYDFASYFKPRRHGYSTVNHLQMPAGSHLLPIEALIWSIWVTDAELPNSTSDTGRYYQAQSLLRIFPPTS